MRITRKELEELFNRLAKAKGWNTDPTAKDSYLLNHYNPDPTSRKAWRIESNGGSHILFPSNGTRLTTTEMYWAITAMLNIHYRDF